MDTNFKSETHKEIRARILKAPKAKVSGNKINHIACPSCGKPEAYCYHDEPHVIICHRMSKCGEKTLTRDLYSDLYSNLTERFPKTKEQPHATARAYLESRGLDPKRVEFTQGAVKDGESFYPTVKIEFGGVTFHRLIDYTGKDKNRLTPYKEKVFESPLVNQSDEVWIVEGIFDALSLEQSGIAAIATLSSTHLPAEYFTSNKAKKYVLAFDNDEAGKKAINKFMSFFEKESIEFIVALPPLGQDWNDHLLSGELNQDQIEKTLKLARCRGRLATASTPSDYFKTHYGQHEINGLIFEFNHQLYKGMIKEARDQTNEYFAKRIADCSLVIAYSIEDDSLPMRSRTTHIIKAYSTREGTNLFRVSSDELANLTQFKSQLMNYRQIFFGGSGELSSLVEYLFRKKPQKVRECHALGYDEKSGNYVFSSFLYDREGKRYTVNEHKFFPDHNLMPFREKTIENFVEIDVSKFITDLFKTYGHKGLLALGFWVAATFSHSVFKKFGFFPFLSMHGDPHCGKSDLTTLLNRCFFIDWEGITMSRANTQKGELRRISQKSGLVNPMLEGRADKSRFDYDSILPLYNRNSPQVRAQKSNDNSVYELKFSGALAFVQNIEQFTTKAAKERVISLQFSADNLDNTYQAWRNIKTYSPEQLAGVGHYILNNRKHFETEINGQIESLADMLKEDGVPIDRIAKNHAVCLAGIVALMELVDVQGIEYKKLIKYTSEIAKTKIETARSENLLADLFFQYIENKSSADGVTEKDDCLLVHMTKALESIGENWNKKELLTELKQSDSYTGERTTRAFGGKPVKCWVFKTEKPRLQSYKPLEAA